MSLSGTETLFHSLLCLIHGDVLGNPLCRSISVGLHFAATHREKELTVEVGEGRESFPVVQNMENLSSCPLKGFQDDRKGVHNEKGSSSLLLSH